MKNVIRLTESELVRFIKSFITEQTNKPITIKELEKDGYKVEVGNLPLSSHKNKNLIFDETHQAVGQTTAAAYNSLNKILSYKGIITSNRNNGFFVYKILDNNNIKIRWITIKQ